MSEQLVEGWVPTTIGEICDLVNGRAFKPSDWTEEGLPIVRIQNLNRSDAGFNLYSGQVDAKFLIQTGQLLFAWSGTPGTSFGAHVWKGGEAVLNQHIFKVEFDEDAIDKSFFARAINQTLDDLIAQAHGGVGLRHVTKGVFEATPIGLPPLPEQRRIVAKLDRLSARSRAARDHLARTAKLAARAKQTILDAAFEVDSPQAELQTLVDRDRGIPYGIVQTGSHTPGGVPTVRCGDIKQFSIEVDGLKQVEQNVSDAYRRTILKGGEVLIAIRGSVGETCVVPDTMAGCNISREVAMIPLSEEVCPRFIMYFLRSKAATRYILANIKGVAQTGINLGDLRALPTPALLSEDQKCIVRRIEAAFARIDRLTAEAARAAHLLDRLDERLLAKAFRGELVPQDPSDEPAEALLARIRVARAEAPRPRRGRRARAS